MIVGSKRQLRVAEAGASPATGSGRLTRAIVRRFSSSLSRAVSPGLFELGQARVDLREQVGLDDRPDRALLAVIAGDAGACDARQATSERRR